ncbi:MAG: hypothetical protein ACOZNI_04555 [Myxococcota bacterium]
MSLVRLSALLLAVALAAPPAQAAPRGNQLSKRAQLRYQDVLTTRDGSRWRGKLVEKGDVYRIRLADQSEVAVPKAEVASVTRELDPAHPHRGQWVTRASAGFEAAVAIGEGDGGFRIGPYTEVALGLNVGGALEPEVIVAVSPIGPAAGSYTPQLAVGARYYGNTSRPTKPFSTTQLVVFGSHADLGLRIGGGALLDVSPNFGLGVSQGVTLLTQTDPDTTALGYHAQVQAQGRF